MTLYQNCSNDSATLNKMATRAINKLWNFSLILSIFDFKCKFLNQNATINGRDIINTSVKVKIVKNGKYLTYPKIDRYFSVSKLGISL